MEGAVITGREIRNLARERVTDYKIPDLVRFLDVFPMTGTGKIERRELERSEMLELTTTGV